MPNNFVIDRVCSVVVACLNVLCLYGTLLENSTSRAGVGATLLARGGGSAHF